MKLLNCADVLVLGAGPGALAIAAALGEEKLQVDVLSAKDPKASWPYTYGIWGEEVDELGFEELLKYRWSNTVSYLGEGAKDKASPKNIQTKQKFFIIFDEGVLVNSPSISITNDGGLQGHIKEELVLEKYQSVEELAKGINVKVDSLYNTIKNYNYSVKDYITISLPYLIIISIIIFLLTLFKKTESKNKITK